MSNEVFGQRIRQLRANNHLTMEELAKKLSITKSRVNMWENSGVIPREDVLVEISKYFEVSIDYLLGNSEMEGKNPDNETLQYLQRNLEKLDNDRLKKAEGMLKAVFGDIFKDGEDSGEL